MVLLTGIVMFTGTLLSWNVKDSNKDFYSLNNKETTATLSAAYLTTFQSFKEIINILAELK